MFRIIGFLLFSLLLFSCNTSKNVRTDQSGVDVEVPVPAHHDNAVFYLGEVQFLDCGTVVRVTSGEKKDNYAPVNLDPKFKTDKLRLKLKFKILDEKSTECSEFPAIKIIEAFAVR